MTLLADDGVVAVGRAFDELRCLCKLGRPLDLFLRGIKLAVGDVVADGVREEEGVLEYESNALSELPQLKFTDVDAIDCNRAAVYVVEAWDEAGHGGLSGGGGSDESDRGSGGHAQREVAQDWQARLVGEGDVIEADCALSLRQLAGVGGFADGWFLLEDIPDARRGGHCALASCNHLA